jgi:hypothetical protein
MATYHTAVAKPSSAHTLQEFISVGENTANKFDYLDFCMVERLDGVPYVVANVLDDYLYELKESSVEVTLKATEADQYRYNPKKLADRLYGSTILYHIILKINDMASVHDFTLKNRKLKLIPPTKLGEYLSKIYSMEKTAINYYNTVHKNDVAPTTVRKFRI